MKLRFRTSFPLAAFAVWCLPLLAPAADEDAEALTSGPIHEAFAQPVALDQVERYVISQPPPESVDEIPPDEKPEGDNVVWIPGYWQWDDDEEDFIWISGCWRAVPPGTTWVPGYWGETEGGYEWVSGYWQTEEVKETVYLSAPPATLERGPTTPAPSVESVWVQGTWVWRSPTLLRRSRYAWRPGYWLSPRPDWIWVPSRYVYTPRGYVYVDGYWDYVLERRGVLFLPYRLRHRHAVGVGVRFRLTPHFVFDLGFLTDSLFWSPRRCHYYFGDYYGARYVAIGYHPWYETPRHRRAYDPIFVHARWRHRDDRDWERKHRSEYEDRRDRQYERPPRTYRDMKKYVSEHSGPQRPRAGVARPLKDFSQDRNQKVKFEKLSPNRMEEIRSRGRELEDRRRDRSQRETVRERRVTPTDSRPGRSDDRPDAPRTNRVNPVPPLRVDSIGRRRPTPTVPTPEVRRPTPTVPTPEVRRPTAHGSHAGGPSPDAHGSHARSPSPDAYGSHARSPPPDAYGSHAGGPPPDAYGSHAGGPSPDAYGSHAGDSSPDACGSHAGGPSPDSYGSHAGDSSPDACGSHAGGPSPDSYGSHAGDSPPDAERA